MEIYRRIEAVYSDYSYSNTVVIECGNKFLQENPLKILPSVAALDGNIRQRERAFRVNSIKIREFSQMLSISVETVYSITHSLGYHKVAAQ